VWAYVTKAQKLTVVRVHDHSAQKVPEGMTVKQITDKQKTFCAL